MSRRRPLDYETPEPIRRVGFLSKGNPKATLASVARHAVAYALIARAIWLVLAYFRPGIRGDWRFTLTMWVCIAALIRAVCEWQLDDD
jgi:hypothetical protein